MVTLYRSTGSAKEQPPPPQALFECHKQAGAGTLLPVAGCTSTAIDVMASLKLARWDTGSLALDDHAQQVVRCCRCHPEVTWSLTWGHESLTEENLQMIARSALEVRPVVRQTAGADADGDLYFLGLVNDGCQALLLPRANTEFIRSMSFRWIRVEVRDSSLRSYALPMAAVDQLLTGGSSDSIVVHPKETLFIAVVRGTDALSLLPTRGDRLAIRFSFNTPALISAAYSDPGLTSFNPDIELAHIASRAHYSRIIVASHWFLARWPE